MTFGSTGQITKLAGIVVILVGGLFLLNTVSSGNLFSIGGAAPTSAATIDSTPLPVTAMYTISTVDLRGKAIDSIADTTGVKNGVAADMKYYKEGDTIPFDTTTGSTTAYASSSSDPAPSQKIFMIANASSYYTAKTGLKEVPYSSEMMWTIEMDKINTLSVYGQNSTSGDWKADTMAQEFATDKQRTLTFKLEGATARGVYKAPIVICLNYSTADWSSTGTYVVKGVKTDVPTGVANDAESCYISNLESIEDTETKLFSVHFTPVSGVNPSAGVGNMSIEIIDCGATYTKDTGELLYSGCQNGDTLNGIGAIDYNYTIYVS